MSGGDIYSNFVVGALAVLIGAHLFPELSLFASHPAIGNPNDLQNETVTAWDEYIRNADQGMQARLKGATPFLWIDEFADRGQRVARGEIVVSPVISHGSRRVPNGLIHDWIGGIFIPGATIKSLSAVTHNYDKYKEFYKPIVVDSKSLACAEDVRQFSMVWRYKMFITAAIKAEYKARDVKVDSRRGYSLVDTVQVQEIENYGTAEERLLPPGTGNGYVWRLHSIARYEQRDGGVYLELEAIALTRDIPGSVRWFVGSIVNHLSKNSLATTLQQTRDAVKSTPATSEARSSSCLN